jgi:hypothetical protein
MESGPADSRQRVTDTRIQLLRSNYLFDSCPGRRNERSTSANAFNTSLHAELGRDRSGGNPNHFMNSSTWRLLLTGIKIIDRSRDDCRFIGTSTGDGGSKHYMITDPGHRFNATFQRDTGKVYLYPDAHTPLAPVAIE